MKQANKFNQISIGVFAVFTAMLLWFCWYQLASAADLSISPSGGTYNVGSIFEVSVLLNTKGQEVNAVQMQLSFPTSKLEFVSSSAVSSIIEIYTTPPRSDNGKGTVDIIGGIPNGISASSGLIAKLTFRVKSVGAANLRFTGESQVLLNDGRGTDVLENTIGATYKLQLPPYQGPIVVSDTHPSQEAWHKGGDVNLRWDLDLSPADGYSYIINNKPIDALDDISESTDTSVSFKNVPAGLNYFHIKALRDGQWGAVTHYALRIDNNPPEDFYIKVTPNSRTFITRPLISFTSSDQLSGIDKYEIKILPLKINGRPKASLDNQLFVDVTSPYQTQELLPGSYEILVRAYDKAGNFKEVTEKLEITDSVLWFLSQEGVSTPLGGKLSWSVVFPLMSLLLLVLLVTAYLTRKWYSLVHEKVRDNYIPQAIALQLQELKNYRQKYGRVIVMLVACILGFGLLSGAGDAVAQDGATGLNAVQEQALGLSKEAVEQGTPLITSFSTDIKDDEQFYVSGRTSEPNTQVEVSLRSIADGSLVAYTVISDDRGDWLYRHDNSLSSGRYIIWAHAKSGAQLSYPGSQAEMKVKPVAISLGGTKIAYQSLYTCLILILLLVIAGLLAYIIIHAHLVRRRRIAFAQSLRETEDSIKRGFIALRQDIEAELVLFKKANLSAELTKEQEARRTQFMKDLENIEKLVGKEVWQVETFNELPDKQK